MDKYEYKPAISRRQTIKQRMHAENREIRCMVGLLTCPVLVALAVRTQTLIESNGLFTVFFYKHIRVTIVLLTTTKQLSFKVSCLDSSLMFQMALYSSSKSNLITCYLRLLQIQWSSAWVGQAPKIIFVSSVFYCCTHNWPLTMAFVLLKLLETIAY